MSLVYACMWCGTIMLHVCDVIGIYSQYLLFNNRVLHFTQKKVFLKSRKKKKLPIKSLGKSMFAIKGLQHFSCLKRIGGKMKMNEPDTGVYTVIRKTVTKKGTCAEAGLEHVTVGLAAYQLSK